MKKQFTLVEMIIVIAIMAILSAIIIPNISNMKSKGMIAMVNGNLRVLQTAVDMYALDHNGEFPVPIAPTIGNPQLIQFDKLYPNYIKSLPKEEGISKQNYWVDYSGRVWGSTVDAPSNFYYASGNLEWNTQNHIRGYNVYEIKEKTTGSLKNVKTFSLKKSIILSGSASKISFDLGEEKENYLISAVDQYGLETAPVNFDYEGTPQITPILRQEGTFYFEIHSEDTLYWDDFKTVEDKPEGTNIEYAFAVGDNPEELDNFVSDFYSLEPAKHMKIKITMTSYGGKYPSLYDLRVYYHYADEIVLVSRRVAESANRVVDEVKLEDEQHIDQIIVTDSYDYRNKPTLNVTYSPDGSNYFPVKKISEIPSGSYIHIERESTSSGVRFKNPLVKATTKPIIVQQESFSSGGSHNGQNPEPENNDPQLQDKEWETIQTLSFFVSPNDGQMTHWIRAEIEDIQPENTRILYRYSVSNGFSWSIEVDDIGKVTDSKMLRVRAYLQVKKEHLSQFENPTIVSIKIYHSKGVSDLSLVKPTGAILLEKSNNPGREDISVDSVLTWNYEAFDPQEKEIVEVQWGGDKRDRYETPGTYTVTLKLRNELNYWSDEIKYTFEVKAEKPIAVISPENNQFSSRGSVDFKSIHSYDPDNDEIVKEEWGGDYQSSGIYPPGTYTVTLRVQDSEGNWSDWTEKTFTTIDSYFYGIPVEALDNNDATSTFVNNGNTIMALWDVDLTGRRVTILHGRFSVLSSNGESRIYVYDKDNNPLNFMYENSNKVVNYIEGGSKTTSRIIIPENAAKIAFKNMVIYTLKTEDDISVPENVRNITSTSSKISIILNWDYPFGSDIQKVAIFRNGQFVNYATGNSYEDKPLYIDQTYNYTLYAVNSFGNYSAGVNHIASTQKSDIAWRDLDPKSYDGITSTSSGAAGNNYIIFYWEGDLHKKIVTMTFSYWSSSYSSSITVLDESQQPVSFTRLDNQTTVTSLTGSKNMQTVKIIVPENAKYIKLHNIALQEIEAKEDLVLTENVSGVNSTSTDKKITLSWNIPVGADIAKVAIYRNGTFIAHSTSSSYEDNGLQSSTTYTYTLKAISSLGVPATGVTHVASTNELEVVWIGLDPKSYDGNITTGAGAGPNSSITFSWEGNLHEKVISLYFVRWSSNDQPIFTVLDENDQELEFYRVDTQSTVSSLNPTNLTIGSGYVPVKITIPSEAKKIKLRNISLHEIVYE